MSRWLVLFAFALGCKGSDKVTTDTGAEGDADTDTDADADADCEAVISSLTPADGSVDVDTTVDVVATFTAPAPEGMYAILVDGVPGSTALSTDGLVATFTADAPYAPDATFTATASVCTQTQITTFTTIGSTLDPNDLTGNTYGILFDNLEFTDPPQNVIDLAAGVAGFDTDFFVLVGLQTYDPLTQTLVAAAGTGAEYGGTILPDCDAAIGDIPADFSSNPSFSVGPADFTVPYDANGTLTIEQFALGGTFTVDGAFIENVAFSGELDMRPTGQKCSTAAVLGGNCVLCNDGVKECLNLVATAAQAPLISGLDLVLECAL